jgi:hypothetical protein
VEMAELHLSFRKSLSATFITMAKISELAEMVKCELDVEQTKIDKKTFIFFGTDKRIQRLQEEIRNEGIPGGKFVSDSELKEKKEQKKSKT